MTAAIDSSETAARLAESIAALPPLPATAQEILACFGDEFIDAVKVAEVVEGDPGICARLLGLANSAYFGLAEPVNCINEAISRVLGVDTVRSLVLAMAIQKTFSSQDCPAFDLEHFWTHSLLTAECCKRVVAADEQSSDVDRDLAYSAGLCYNLGLMALVHLSPSRTNTVLTKLRNGSAQDRLAQYMIAEFDTDHRIMTAELTRTWSLPEPMVAAFQYRAFPGSHCDTRLGVVVSAAVVAVENTDLEEDEQESLSDWADLLGIDTGDMQEMAVFEDRQQDRVRSLASNMTR